MRIDKKLHYINMFQCYCLHVSSMLFFSYSVRFHSYGKQSEFEHSFVFVKEFEAVFSLYILFLNFLNSFQSMFFFLYGFATFLWVNMFHIWSFWNFNGNELCKHACIRFLASFYVYLVAHTHTNTQNWGKKMHKNSVNAIQSTKCSILAMSDTMAIRMPMKWIVIHAAILVYLFLCVVLFLFSTIQAPVNVSSLGSALFVDSTSFSKPRICMCVCSDQQRFWNETSQLKRRSIKMNEFVRNWHVDILPSNSHAFVIDP